LPSASNGTCDEAEKGLDADGYNDVVVGAFFDARLLSFGSCAVLHDLRLVASENCNTINPLSVSQHASPEHHHFNVKRNYGTIIQLKVALKLVQELIRLLTLNLGASEVADDVLLSLGQPDNALVGLLVLQVCFSVQIFGLNVANTFWDCTVQEKHVTWE
jgi:hypothetical protein